MFSHHVILHLGTSEAFFQVAAACLLAAIWEGTQIWEVMLHRQTGQPLEGLQASPTRATRTCGSPGSISANLLSHRLFWSSYGRGTPSNRPFVPSFT